VENCDVCKELAKQKVNMKQQLNLSKTFFVVCGICITIGIAAFTYGFITEPQRTWANYLLNNFYFLSLAVGAAFFLAIQAITRSGWSAAFRRVPEAMMMYVPIAGLLLLFLYFGMHYVYHWSHADVVAGDELIRHKLPYLNVPFFFIRIIVFFVAWIILIRLIRKASLNEDATGGIENFRKIEKFSRIFIFILAVSFSLLGFDLLMSIESHWFSTIYSLKNFVAAFQHGAATIFIIVLLLNRRGYFEFLNLSHIHDFARYIFILSIFYGYFWFSQFLLIWYANIPEETIYYAKRWVDEWQPFWVADIIINWAIPFFVLLPVNTSRNKWVVFAVAIVMVAGQWVDLFVEIFPGAVAHSYFGFIEIGSYVGFAGLFALVTGYSLSKASLIPQNHPLIQESYQHHFESYI
jgi:hypothetical protein